ncbi:uncharacterized protein [Triticum aestivum]|uniref:uncharacterized protein isoform X1 n=1 Tax=Triticum aestivum TaxID=4565 RepID=UPI001D02D054|nr:uncharacterized protein LOC123087689 isoform X1 [Triticum aestivum]
MARATDVDDGAAPLPPPPEPPPTERSRPPPPALEGSPAIVLPARSPDCGGSRDPESTAQIGGFLHPAKWRILFEDVRAIGLRSEGVLFTYYPSRWMVVRDLDNDILGGRYLNEEEEISEGTRLLIDNLEVTICSFLQEEPEVHDQTEVIDLTDDPKRSKPQFGERFSILADADDDVPLAKKIADDLVQSVAPPHATSPLGKNKLEQDTGVGMATGRVTGRATVRPTAVVPSITGDRRVGGRFWALAEFDEEEADDDEDASPVESPLSPTPSDIICEFFHSVIAKMGWPLRSIGFCRWKIRHGSVYTRARRSR